MSTSQSDTLPAQVEEYLREHGALTLASASPSGIPHASTFLYVNEGPTLYFWSKTNTVTAQQVGQNPLVSFTIDEYATDLNQTRGVQGMGECSVLLNGTEIARVAALFGSKFPSLAPGNTMSISFFRITPTEIQFIDNTAASGGGAQRGEFGAEFHRERAYSVFSGLPVIAPAEIISETLQILRVDAGSVVARQGGPADKFFIVFEGQVEVVREDGGAPEALTSLGPGQFFGEAAILADRPRAATIRALEPSTLVAIDRDTFRDLLAQSLGTTREFDELIRTRLRSAGSGS